MKVTITGADNVVDPSALAELWRKYPFVEWGILYSRNRPGRPRYPDLDWIAHFAGFRCARSLHLCGIVARDFLDGRPFSPEGFERVQVNGYKGQPHDLAKAHSHGYGAEIILQVRKQFLLPGAARDALALPNASILYDPSGGRGVQPDRTGYPNAPAGVRMGIAGGIGPDNVAERVTGAALASASWIDMESGVRDENDQFDLGKVETVLSTVAEAMG